MRRWRLGVTSLGLVAALVTTGATTATADDAPSICVTTTDPVAGTSAEIIGIRVQAFDCAGDAVPFSGTVRVGSTGAPAAGSPGAADVPVSSADGSPTVSLVDIGAFEEGQLTFDPQLVAPGGSAADRPVRDFSPAIRLAKDQASTNQPYNGRTHALSPVPFAYMAFERQQWGCDAVRLVDAACVLSTRTSPDQSWQQGYKLTVGWPDPGQDASGRPNARCRVWPRIGLSWHDPSDPDPYSTVRYTVILDVPAEWGGTTLPLGPGTFQTGVVPGRTTVDVDYTCYQRADGGPRTFAEHTVSNQLIPDLPPSQPAEVEVDAVGTDLQAQSGGSAARGAAPVQGYDMTVLDESGAAVETARVPAAQVPQTRGMSASTASGAALHTFRSLRAGRYTVRVAAYNAVGASTTITSRSVTVTSSQPVTSPAKRALRPPRHVRARMSAAHVRVTWRVPSATGGGIARYRVSILRGSHLVQRATVGRSVRAFTSRHLTTKKALRVVVAAIARDGRIAAAPKRLVVRR